MKIKLSKSQWQEIGKKTGWIKTAQDMGKEMDDFFSPCITLKRHMLNGKVISGHWHVDKNKDFSIVKQLMEEAGINKGFGTSISDSDLDAFEIVAGKHGYSVETIGD